MTKLMCFSARMELLRSVQMKYHDAIWSEQAKILDGFVAAADYDRKYSIRLLHDPETPGIYGTNSRQLLMGYLAS